MLVVYIFDLKFDYVRMSDMDKVKKCYILNG